MKPLRISLLLLLLAKFSITQAQEVTKVLIYKKFPKGQTTMGFMGAFRHPTAYPGIDTSNVNTQSQLAPADFTQLLTTAKQKKHHQMKIGGVAFAGTMLIANQPHFYLYCGPTLLIDLTARINYWLDPAYSTIFDTKSRQLAFIK